MKQSCNVAALIERYFTERLMRQRNVSANTIASYRDTFRLLFTWWLANPVDGPFRQSGRAFSAGTPLMGRRPRSGSGSRYA
jgi:hypothetical protein